MNLEETLPHIIDKDIFFYYNLENIDDQINSKYIKNIITNIIFIGFDDNIGSISEKIYPNNSLDKETLQIISQIGFPETNIISEEGQINYIFNYRINFNKYPLNNVNIKTQKFNYCYTKFIQIKDIKIKRGGFSQKSIIIISNNYSPNIYLPLLDNIYDLYLKNNYIPLNDKTIENFLKNNNFEIKTSEIKNNHNNNNNNEYINLRDSLITEPFPIIKINNFFENFSFYYINKIFSLWELVITEIPIMVFSDSPTICSNIVKLLESLIYPLKYYGDIRPYFSVYDQDFKYYREESHLVKTNIPIIGCINPIHLKYFPDFYILHFDDNYFNENGYNENPTKHLTYLTYDLIEKNKYSFYIKPKKEGNNKFKNLKLLLRTDRNLIKSFYDFVNENKNNEFIDMSRMNIYLRMYLIEMNNDFMRNIQDYLFKYNIEEIQKIGFIKENFSIYEIFDEKKFCDYLNKNKDNNIFNKKYMNNIKKCCELYKKFFKTKIFYHFLEKLLPKIKHLKKEE